MVRDENSDPTIAQGAHQTLDITHRKRVNAGKRFVEQDEFRFPGLSGLLRTLLDSEGLVRISARIEGLEAGTPVDVLLFES